MADDFVDYDAPIQVAGVASALKGTVKEYIKDAIAHANRAMAKGKSAEEILKETKGVAQPGLHGKALAIVPHGDVEVPYARTFKEGVTAAEMYPSKNLMSEIPGLLEETRLYHDPKLKFGDAAVDYSGKRIKVNPYQFQNPKQARAVMAHELTHSSAIQDQGFEGLGPLTGTSPEFYRFAADQPMLEQLGMASKIRGGRLPLSSLDPRFQKSEQFGRLLSATPREFDEISQQAAAIRAMGPNAYQQYLDTYGEQLARYMENPNLNRRRDLIPHKAANPFWLGPRHAAGSRSERLMSSDDVNPSTMFANDVRDFLELYLTNKR